MKVGDYVRIKSGYIDKIININDFREPSMKYALEQPSWNDDIVFIGEKDIIKSSPNIIDLIEVGDILTFDDGSICRIIGIEDKYYLLKDLGDTQYYQKQEIVLDNLKSIITKEQIECIEYKVGE